MKLHSSRWWNVLVAISLLLLCSSVQAGEEEDDCGGGSGLRGGGSCVPSMPTGAQYKVEFSFPMIGSHAVIMDVLDDSKGQLVVEGGYPIRDKFDYTMHHTLADGTVSFSANLSEKLQGILNQFTVHLSEIRYDPKSDAASVHINILSVLNFPLHLHRVNKDTDID